MNLDVQQVAQDIDHNVAFALFHFFAAIDAAVSPVILGFDVLRVLEQQALPFFPATADSSHPERAPRRRFCPSGGDGRAPFSNEENREASLSGILCLRHSMLERSIYAKQEEAGGSRHDGAAVDPARTH
ncbi:hypothetical protein KW114_12510 [Methylococcus capsulatus]|nr:hypothetical protein [Methylococcus capsulatus]QXP89886.1 hypothetical protein KW114_12510 [Methylococcus capsulatus]